MKLSSGLLAIGASALLFGCASSKPVISFEYASATETKIDSQNAKDYGTVTSECVSAGENGFGLMETAVSKALAQIPGATFIKEPRFSSMGNCISVTGTAMGPQ